ncbi:MAG: DUF2927 domain-containing protein [Acidimicrobiia bacterium]
MEHRLGLAVGALLTASLFACGDDATTTLVTTTTRAATTTTVAPTTTLAPTFYSADAVAYFEEVAFGQEFGGDAPEIRKWTHDVRMVVHGDPSDEDLVTLYDVIADLNTMIGTIVIDIVASDGNFDIHFAPESEFAAIEPNYVPVNMGFFWVWWDGGGNITDARVLISTSGLTQPERNHLIREEVTQSLGLMRDSIRFEDSIFYQGWTETQEYSEFDELLIEMLYLPEIEPQMTAAEARAVIPGG